MNRQDIIDMIAKVYGVVWTNETQLKDLEKFAELVASTERERCAELRSQLHFFCFDKPSSVGKQELVGLVNQALDDYQKLIRTGNV